MSRSLSGWIVFSFCSMSLVRCCVPSALCNDRFSVSSFRISHPINICTYAHHRLVFLCRSTKRVNHIPNQLPVSKRQTRWCIRCKSHFANIYWNFCRISVLLPSCRGVCDVVLFALCCTIVDQFCYLWLDEWSSGAQQPKRIINFQRNKLETKKHFVIITWQMTSDPDPDLSTWSRRDCHFYLTLELIGEPLWQPKEWRKSNISIKAEKMANARRARRAARTHETNKNKVRKTVRITVHLIKFVCEEKNHFICASAALHNYMLTPSPSACVFVRFGSVDTMRA